MIAPNEFWLHLHLLAEAYLSEGASPQKRAEAIVSQFENLPRLTQRVLLADLSQLAIHGPDLYSAVLVAAQTEPPNEPNPASHPLNGAPAR